MRAFNTARVDGITDVDPAWLPRVKRFHAVHELHMPSYYAIFLNQGTNDLLKSKNVRLALNAAIPRQALVQNIFDGHASLASGPLPYAGIRTADQTLVTRDDIEEARRILEEAEVATDEEGRYGKITLVVPDLAFLVATGKAVEERWEELGFDVEVIVLEPGVVTSEIIRTRNYDALLFGNALSRNPDILSFWHTNERFYPGLNLGLYSNKAADALLESVRQTFDEEERRSDLASLQSLIIQDMPVLFLYSPNYIIVTAAKVRGFSATIISNPAERFENIENWYVKTKRVWGKTATNNQE